MLHLVDLSAVAFAAIVCGEFGVLVGVGVGVRVGTTIAAVEVGVKVGGSNSRVRVGAEVAVSTRGRMLVVSVAVAVLMMPWHPVARIVNTCTITSKNKRVALLNCIFIPRRTGKIRGGSCPKAPLPGIIVA